jgi:deazaflavin-dependent oxidoreductase (nitroreductase family)
MKTMNQGSQHPTTRPLRRRIQARAMRVVNVPMRLLLRLPFPTPLGARLMLISYTGRKSGKAYRQPVSYVQQGDTLLSPGGGAWKWNLRDGEPVRLRLRGREVAARPELVADPAEVGRLLEEMMAANPGVRAFVGIPRDPDGHLDRERLETAVRYGFRVVRWHLGGEAEKSER